MLILAAIDSNLVLCPAEGLTKRFTRHSGLHMLIRTGAEVGVTVATIEILCADASRLPVKVNHLQCCLRAHSHSELMESGESSTEGSEVPRADVITNRIGIVASVSVASA